MNKNLINKGDEIIGTTYLTGDYDKFKKHSLNREIHADTSKYKSLLKSISASGQLVPILVDRELQVVEGQHRLYICKTLGIKVKYTIIAQDYTIDDIKSMQTTQPWNIVDNITSEISKGNDDYKKIIQYHDKYKFSHSIVASALSGVKYYKKKHCENGTLVITKETERNAVKIFERLAEIQEVIGLMNEKLFIVFYSLFQSKEYKHDRMLKQLKHFPVLFKKDKMNKWGMSKFEMAEFIDKVYNYNVLNSEKVQLIDKYSL